MRTLAARKDTQVATAAAGLFTLSVIGVLVMKARGSKAALKKTLQDSPNLSPAEKALAGQLLEQPVTQAAAAVVNATTQEVLPRNMWINPRTGKKELRYS